MTNIIMLKRRLDKLEKQHGGAIPFSALSGGERKSPRKNPRKSPRKNPSKNPSKKHKKRSVSPSRARRKVTKRAKRCKVTYETYTVEGSRSHYRCPTCFGCFDSRNFENPPKSTTRWLCECGQELIKIRQGEGT